MTGSKTKGKKLQEQEREVEEGEGKGEDEEEKPGALGETVEGTDDFSITIGALLSPLEHTLRSMAEEIPRGTGSSAGADGNVSC